MVVQFTLSADIRDWIMPDSNSSAVVALYCCAHYQWSKLVLPLGESKLFLFIHSKKPDHYITYKLESNDTHVGCVWIQVNL